MLVAGVGKAQPQLAESMGMDKWLMALAAADVLYALWSGEKQTSNVEVQTSRLWLVVKALGLAALTYVVVSFLDVPEDQASVLALMQLLPARLARLVNEAVAAFRLVRPKYARYMRLAWDASALNSKM